MNAQSTKKPIRVPFIKIVLTWWWILFTRTRNKWKEYTALFFLLIAMFDYEWALNPVQAVTDWLVRKEILVVEEQSHTINRSNTMAETEVVTEPEGKKKIKINKESVSETWNKIVSGSGKAFKQCAVFLIAGILFTAGGFIATHLHTAYFTNHTPEMTLPMQV